MDVLDTVKEAERLLDMHLAGKANEAVERIATWKGKAFYWLEPVVGACYRGNSCPLVDGSHWVQVTKNGERWTVRVL